jgi:hypothetical protein
MSAPLSTMAPIQRGCCAFGAVLVSPADGLDRLPEITVRRLAAWANGFNHFNQRPQNVPLCVGQHLHCPLPAPAKPKHWKEQ